MSDPAVGAVSFPPQSAAAVEVPAAGLAVPLLLAVPELLSLPHAVRVSAATAVADKNTPSGVPTRLPMLLSFTYPTFV